MCILPLPHVVKYPRMATTFSMLSTINAALLAQGQNPVTENDGSIEWRMLSANWPFIVESELEAGNFHFTREEATVTTYTTGKFGFTYAYAVPAGALYVRNVWEEYSDGTQWEVDWTQNSTSVHTDAGAGVVIEYIVVPEPTAFPANFVTGIKMVLEAHILRALKEEYSEAERFEEKAMFYLQRARTKSSSSRSKYDLRAGGGSIIEARKRRG